MMEGESVHDNLHEVLNSMASKNVIELVDGAYKIKPNQGKSVIKTLLKTLKVILWENPLAPWSYNRKLPFFPKPGNTRVSF